MVKIRDTDYPPTLEIHMKRIDSTANAYLVATAAYGNIFIKAPKRAFPTDFKVWRHAGDLDDGNTDSWYIMATVSCMVKSKPKSWEKDRYIPARVERTFTMLATMEHGITAVRAGALITQILVKGINVKNWYDVDADQHG